MTTLGVLIPCRNESAVIARKLRNLRACRWPASARPHRVVVIDDGSEDGCAELARSEARSFDASRIAVQVIANTARPGKGGAIAAGVAACGADVDVLVLSDADVVLEQEALTALAAAFEREPELGMATGAQRFVVSLCDDGTLAAVDGGPLRSEDGFYDWASARVRALESRHGLVFSVHGQLLAWRSALALAPTPGVAADDLDLMLQVRLGGRPIRRVADAVFCEVRAPQGDPRRQQAVRRARAYHQFLRHPRVGELREQRRWIARRQAALYLRAGRARGPWTLITLASVFGAGWYFGPQAAIAAAALNALLFLPPWILMRMVRSRMEIAEALEARAPMAERWETARR